MKSIVYSETGAPSVLHLVERELPEPGTGEVRIRITVSGVNPTDWKSRKGGHPGRSLDFPEIVPNQDGAGTVDAVGPGVDGFTVGDRVWVAIAAWKLANGGTAQEYTVLPAERIYALPDAASFDLGANLGVPAITAHRALTVSEEWPDRLAPGALTGAIVLVAGGAGAVGHAAIELARWAGATVITTVSGPTKAQLATAAGAHHVVNYRESDAAAEIRGIAPDGVDIIVEVAPNQNAELNSKVLKVRGSIAVYAAGSEPLALDLRPLMFLNARYEFQMLYTLGQKVLDAAAEDINAAMVDGALTIGEKSGLPVERFDLEHTADAHAAVEADFVGKVLIDVSQPAS